MSETNPYKPPVAIEDAAAAPASDFQPAARAVDAGRAWEWLVSGFGLFKKQPGMWIVLLIVYLVVSILIALVPVLGSLANLVLYPVFSAGLMLGCRALDRGEELQIGHLFAGFKQNTSDLLMVGLIALAGWIVILIPMFLIVGGGAFFAALRGDASAIAAFGLTFALAFLIVLALSIPLYMALWFAPALVAFHQLKPMEALKASFYACLKNFMPFLLYGLIVLVLTFIASIPFGLGFLLLVPVVIASIYTAYQDIFLAA
jgi:uncharacterized membrane protein